MAVDNPLWNQAREQRYHIKYGNLFGLYDAVDRRITYHRGLTMDERRAHKSQIFERHGTLAIAGSKVKLHDAVIDNVEVELSAGISPASGEWVNFAAKSRLTSDRVTDTFYRSLPELKAKLESVSGNEWEFFGDDAIVEKSDFPMRVGIAPKEPDDPDDYSLVCVYTFSRPLARDQFLREAVLFKMTSEIVVDHLYTMMNEGLKPIPMDIVEKDAA